MTMEFENSPKKRNLSKNYAICMNTAKYIWKIIGQKHKNVLKVQQVLRSWKT